ncbi:hypothetical protein ES706_01889 [subsurface metagenome]
MKTFGFNICRIFAAPVYLIEGIIEKVEKIRLIKFPFLLKFNLLNFFLFSFSKSNLHSLYALKISFSKLFFVSLDNVSKNHIPHVKYYL